MAGRDASDDGAGIASDAGTASIVRTTKRAVTGDGAVPPLSGTAPSSTRCAAPTAAVSAASAPHEARRRARSGVAADAGSTVASEGERSGAVDGMGGSGKGAVATIDLATLPPVPRLSQFIQRRQRRPGRPRRHDTTRHGPVAPSRFLPIPA